MIELRHGTQGLLERRPGVDAMQLVQLDAFEPKPAQTHLQLLPQIFRAPYGGPLIRPLPREAPFGRDDKVPAIRIQSLGDQPLTYFGTV